MICLIFMHPLKVPWKVSKLISTYYEILGFAMLLKDDLQHISQWLNVGINVLLEFHTKISKKQRLICSDFLATFHVKILNFSTLYLNFKNKTLWMIFNHHEQCNMRKIVDVLWDSKSYCLSSRFKTLAVHNQTLLSCWFYA